MVKESARKSDQPEKEVATSERSEKGSKDTPPIKKSGRASVKSTATTGEKRINAEVNDEEPEEEETQIQLYFHRTIQFAILINSAQMGLELNLRSGSWPMIWEVSDHFFTAFFLCEAIIKLYQHRLEYFTDKQEKIWNCLDFFVVCITVLDLWILTALDVQANLDFVRVIRLVRLSRVLRLLKEQKDLMMVVIGIVGSLKSMAWVGVLLLVVVYATAIACCTVIGGSDIYTEDNPEVLFSQDGQQNLFRAMFTLLNLSLGQGHMETFNPLYENHAYMLPFMWAYVGLVTVGILNAIIGIICEKTADAGRATLKKEKWAFMDKQRAMVDALKKLMWEVNDDDDGIISQEELNEASTDPRFVDMLGEINLPTSFNVADMHLMLDKDGDGELTEDEFADGMYDLVYSDDFQRQCILLRSLANAKRNLHYFRIEVKQDFEDLRKMMQLILEGKVIPAGNATTPGPEKKLPTAIVVSPGPISPGPPGGSPTCLSAAWEDIGEQLSPMAVARRVVVDTVASSTQDEELLKQVRTNALKAVAAGAWELLEQEGAVTKDFAEAGNLNAMKQVRARALKLKAERQASSQNLRPGTSAPTGNPTPTMGMQKSPERLTTAPAGMQSSEVIPFSNGCFEGGRLETPVGKDPPAAASMEAARNVRQVPPEVTYQLPGTPEVTGQNARRPWPAAREEL